MASLPHTHTSTTSVPTLHCIECLRPWYVASERWLLKLTDDEMPEAVPYCPDCATREFGNA